MRVRGNKRNLDYIISVRNYRCVTRMNNHSSSIANEASKVAIYRKVPTLSYRRRLDINVSDQSVHTRTSGDICIADVLIATNEVRFPCIRGSILHASRTTPHSPYYKQTHTVYHFFSSHHPYTLSHKNIYVRVDSTDHPILF